MEINFATDSRVALDMLTKRRGGTAHAIYKLQWWSSDQHRGIAEADKIAKRAREQPEEFPEERAPSRGGCSRRKRQRQSWRDGKPSGTMARQEG
jgi:hypothetical protein